MLNGFVLAKQAERFDTTHSSRGEELVEAVKNGTVRLIADIMNREGMMRSEELLLRLNRVRDGDRTLSDGLWVVGQDISPRHLQLPTGHLTEALDEFAGVLPGQFAGLVTELGEPGLRLRVAVRLLR